MPSQIVSPELRAVQRIINALEPFTEQERKRILIYACAGMGSSLVRDWPPVVAMRKQLKAPQTTMRPIRRQA